MSKYGDTPVWCEGFDELWQPDRGEAWTDPLNNEEKVTSFYLVAEDD